MNDILSRHDKIALQFSGGRDSLACLYLLKPYWDRLTVYWCNTGAAYPETLAMIEEVRAMVPHFAEIQGNQPAVIEQFGLPSDMVPVSATPVGLAVINGGSVLMQDRYSCCIRSMNVPTHVRMIEDGITLVIRGQKNADRLKAPMRSGHIEDGIEYLFPIEDWDAKRVMGYLAKQGASIPRFYEMMNNAPDCMTCSAYWEDGAGAYLKRYHHIEFKEYQRRLDIIAKAVGGHIAAFNQEIAS